MRNYQIVKHLTEDMELRGAIYVEDELMAMTLFQNQIRVIDITEAGKRGGNCTEYSLQCYKATGADWNNLIRLCNFSLKALFSYLESSYNDSPDIHVDLNEGTVTATIYKSVHNGNKVKSPFVKYTFDLDKIAPHVAEKWEVGAICEESWGYDQTNVDFYCVVKMTEKSVTLMPLNKGRKVEIGLMSEQTETVGEIERVALPLTRRLRNHGKDTGTSVSGHGFCSLWDGKPVFESHYA